MTRRIHRLILLIALLIGGAGMNYVQAANAQIIVKTTPSGYGTVKAGNSSYQATVQVAAAVGGKLTLYAKPNTGYKFVKWEDNSTAATRTVTVPNAKTTTYTATFAVATYTLTVTSNNTSYGTVTGGGTYNHGASATLTATPKTGYHFVQWSDGVTTASRTISNITANATYTATFAINQYTLTVSSNNTNYGTVTGGGTYNHGAKATLTATPKTGYHFVKWNDNNTNASRQVTVTAAATYTATFAINQYTLTVKTATNNTTQGTVRINSGTAGATASANINHGSSATITATPATGYHFVKWNDNNTNASRSVTVTAAATYTATFAINTYTLQVKTATNNTTQGTVKINSGTAGATASATINHGSSATITATPATGYHFVKWNDNNTNASRSVTVTAAATYTATFAINTYTLTVNSNNTSMGTVTGGGTYNHGATATLTATPKGCYRFKQWNDGVTSSSRTVTVTQAKTYTATFEETTYSGNCGANGNNVTWSLNICTGVLTLSGSGAMSNWDYNSGNYCPWYSYKDEVKTVVIENGITNIGAAAFDRHFELTSITIPNSVTMIDGGAFYSCSKLTSITLPSTLTTIGNGSCCGFAYTQLTSITIPSNVTSIGQWSFCDISTLTDIYVSWTTANAIPTWWNMTNKSGIKLHVPCGTKSLYQVAAGWKNYTITDDIASGTCGTNLTWVLECDSTLRISGTGDMANFGYSSQPWKNISHLIKHVVIGEGVTTIGNYAFYQMDIVTVTNPSTLKTIGSTAFYRCHQLESINFPYGMTSIGNSVTGHGPFYECTSLKAIYIPASLTFINSDTFLRCYSLTSIVVDPANPKYDSRDNCNAIIETATNKLWYGCQTTVIPDGVKTVAQFAFEYQHNLKSIRISNTVTHFETYVFKECENLKDIYVEWTTTPPQDILTAWYEHENLDATITIHVPCGYESLYSSSSAWNRYQIVDDHLKGGMCGAQGSNQTWMLSCDGHLDIKGIGAMADYSAGGAPWNEHKDAIHTVTLADGINTIGENAFVGFTNLTDIYAPWTENIPVLPASNNPQPSVTLHVPCSAISAYQAAGWGNYTVEAEYTASGICGADGDNLTWTLCDDGTLTISGTGEMADWSTADVLWYSYRESITSVIIEDGVTTIGYGAFSNCTALTVVTLPNSVTDIGDHAFNGCSALTSINIPDGVTRIGGYAFKNCISLNAITIPNSVMSIGRDCFYECSALSTLTIMEGVTGSIGLQAFYLCSSLTSVTIPGGITEIGSGAFRFCSSLTSLTIMEGVTSIGGSAFMSCSSLTSVTIPSSVTSIGVTAFDYTSSLTDIYVSWTENIPAWNNMTNKSPQSNITLHVPCGTRDVYAAQDGWKDYQIIEEEYLTGGMCGAQGSNVTWALTCDGTLTIQGTGAMADYMDTDAPWYSHSSDITSVIIGEGITTIGNYAFYQFNSLSSVTVPSTLTSIGSHAFHNCGVLLSITIPDGVATIGEEAFMFCSNLTSITIPNSVTTLGNNVFRFCNKISNIYVSWETEVPAWHNLTSKSPQSGITLHVPCSAMDLYNSTSGWKNYTMVGDEVFTITVTTDDASMGTVSITVP